jgi:hypothetical protein
MYRTIEISLWIKPPFRDLGWDGKGLFMYLCTNHHTHLSGIYYLALATAQGETGLPEERLRSAMDTLSNAGLVRRDAENEIVWVVDMLRQSGFGKNGPKTFGGRCRTAE